MSTDADSPADRKEEIRERHREAAEEVVPDDLGLFVGGEFVDAESGETFATHDPTTGAVLAEVPAGAAADVDRAVAAALEAYEEEWSGYDAGRRQSVLHEVADRIEAERDAFARLETLDNGKPLREAKGDVHAVIDHFRYFAGAARTDEGTALPADDTRAVQTIREPYGVVGAITPWNFPLLIASWKLAPALAAGNAVVLKPAEQTPLTALKLAAEVRDVLPDGVLNVVTGYGEEAGEPLTTHEDVRKLAFTGSTPVGKQVMKNAADDVTDVTLELGGKSPFVVFPDADLESAARNAFLAIFYNKGECCTAGSRMFIHSDVYDEFTDQLVGMAEGTEPADPLLSDTGFGPKVSEEQVQRVEEYVEIAREEGGRFLAGGDRPDDESLADGFFYEPTIIEGLDHDSRAVQEEIFGPVLEVFEFEDYDEMIELANDVDYGLAAGVMTSDVKRAIQTAKDIEAGNVWVNQYNDFPAGQPFGGVKQSGIGREQAKETLEAYTTTKTINISLR
jgi:aldehyde dehydrogenase (NAD+)